MRKLLIPFLATGLLPLHAQQVADSLFLPVFDPPNHAAGKGPVIAIDEAHHNFHTATGRYVAFANTARSDGYRVTACTSPFSPEVLRDIDLLVIANPLHRSNTENWSLPTPSAFTADEIAAVRQWVEDGGRLLLIADHMPFAGAAQDLGSAFGIQWPNSFAMDRRQRRIERFHRGAGLLDHPITSGIDTVVTFTGSAFHLPSGAAGIVALDSNYVLLEPEVAWQFNDSTPSRSGAGWFQIACLQVGRGRVVFSGEAAMFSAQLAGPDRVPIGMNKPEARENVRMLRNILLWLTEGSPTR